MGITSKIDSKVVLNQHEAFKNSSSLLDVAIIGAGPGGITSAIYAKRAGLKVKIIEKGPSGGQIINTNEVENYPGFTKISGFELSYKLEEHAKNLEVEFVYGEVMKVVRDENHFTLTLDDNTVIQSKTLITAQGARPRTLGLENESKFLANGISFCATCDGAFYRGLDSVVVGGGNSAVDEAYFLSNICNKVTVLQNLDHLTASQKGIDLLQSRPNVEIKLGVKVQSYIGDDILQGVTYSDGKQTYSVSADGVFLFVGQKPNSDLFTEFNILDNYGYVIANPDLSTSVKGLFVVGDVRQKHVRQIVTAVGDGAIAINSVLEYLKEN